MSEVGSRGHAALVGNDNEGRTIDTNVGRVTGRGNPPTGLTSFADVFV
jgi:hypothetical protein